MEYLKKPFCADEHAKDRECRKLLQKYNKGFILPNLTIENHEIDCIAKALINGNVKEICGIECEWNSNLYITKYGDVHYTTKHFLSHKIAKYSYLNGLPNFYICFSKNYKHVAICQMEKLYPLLSESVKIYGHAWIDGVYQSFPFHVVDAPNEMVIYAKIEDWSYVVKELILGNFEKALKYDVTKAWF